MRLSVLRPRLAVCRLPPGAEPPEWVRGPGLWSVTHTEDELSVICDERRVPDDVRHEAGWRAIRLVGPFDFSEVGVLLPIVAALAEAKIAILPFATFDTDYLLVKEERLDRARRRLEAAGHRVEVS